MWSHGLLLSSSQVMYDNIVGRLISIELFNRIKRSKKNKKLKPEKEDEPDQEMRSS